MPKKSHDLRTKFYVNLDNQVLSILFIYPMYTHKHTCA